MEKEIKIKTKDGFVIYGNLNTGKKPSKKLIIFCHGLFGTNFDHQFFNSAKFFPQKGFDTYRFHFYCDGKNARHIENSKLSTHGSDITTVINYFKNKYAKIFVVGHSYGGTSILFSDTSKISACVFWDASYIDKGYGSFYDDKFIKQIGMYFEDYGTRTLLSKEFVNEIKNFPETKSLLSKIDKPVLFIGCKNGYATDSKAYFKDAQIPKELKIINSDHVFSTLASEQELFDATLQFLKKY